MPSTLQVLEPAVAILLAVDHLERAGRVAGRLARIHYLRGTPEVGIAYLQPLLERLEAGDRSGALAALYTVQADLLVFSGRGAEELAAADRAAQIARVVGDARILAWAEHARGTALILAGRDEAAVRAITVATQLAEAQGDDALLKRLIPWPGLVKSAVSLSRADITPNARSWLLSGKATRPASRMRRVGWGTVRSTWGNGSRRAGAMSKQRLSIGR